MKSGLEEARQLMVPCLDAKNLCMVHCILVTNHQKSQKRSSGCCWEQVPKIHNFRVYGPGAPNGRGFNMIRAVTIVWRIHCALIVATRTTVVTLALLLDGWDLYSLLFIGPMKFTWLKIWHKHTLVKRRKHISEYGFGDFEVCWWSNLIHIPFSAVRSSFINLLFS